MKFMLNTDGNIVEKIYKSSLKFLIPLTPEETYAIILQEIIKLVGGNFGNLVLVQDNKLEKAYSSSPEGYNVKFRKEGFTYQAFKERRVLVKNISEFKNAHSDLRKLGINWCLFIPLSYQRQALGTISVNSAQEINLSKKMLQGLELFGSMATLAIRKSHIYQDTQKALELRDSFIAMAAHELRTPATTIYGYAQLLQNKISSFDDVEAKWVKEMHFESSRLSMLVKDLLEISRIRSNKLHLDLKICSLSDIIEKIIHYFNINFPARKLCFVNKLGKRDDLVVGDISKLIQVFMNLLDNAIKFSPENTDIILTLDYKRPYLIVAVKDRGRGISKKELPKIFHSFYQGHNSSPEGMGLGLFLSKNLIEKHRGEIRVHSALNKGTTMEIKLPRARI